MELRYEELGVAVKEQHPIRWSKKRIETWGIAISNGILLGFVLWAHMVIK